MKATVWSNYIIMDKAKYYSYSLSFNITPTSVLDKLHELDRSNYFEKRGTISTNTLHDIVSSTQQTEISILKFQLDTIIKQLVSIEFLYEADNVLANFLWFFFIDEVSNIFHYHNIIKKWNKLLEATLVNEILYTRGMICQIQVSNEELDWYIYLRCSPR